MATSDHTHYIIGSAVGPHPFPMIVRDFQSVIGTETKQQCREQIGRLPDTVVAVVGGGSNAAGMFYPFACDPACYNTTLIGVEPGGTGTSFGQHGTATATAAAKFGLECEIFMGEEDMRRQRPNVLRMQLMGAKCTAVTDGSRTLKDATNAAMRDWMATSKDTHYIIGSAVGPHPFPRIVRDFQSVIGSETKRQCIEQIGKLPDTVVAVVGGGSNAAGMFHPFASDPACDHTKLIGVEPGGTGTSFGQHAAAIAHGRPGVLHGSLSYVLQNDDGQTAPVHSISAGLDYPGIGPEHAYWHDAGRVTFAVADDQQALDAFQKISRLEGILPALEPSHALAHVLTIAPNLPGDHVLVLNLCGRGDKDLDEVVRLLDR
ncbi:MAG: tryptophan synthase subunit beta [Planctomycetota bacterium]